MAKVGRKKQIKKQRKKVLIILSTLSIVVLAVIIVVVVVANSSSTPVSCSKGETLNEKTNKCVAKPKAINGREQDAGKYSFVVTDGNNIVFEISSKTMKSLGFSLDFDNLDTGDRYIYLDSETNTFETKTNQEVEELKKDREICLTSEDAWSNFGRDTCVAFRPTYWYNTGNIIFLNEYKEYHNGFVAPIMASFASWDDLRAQYEGKVVAVSGVIERYEGHPEIKVYASRALKIATPIGWSSSKGMIYTMDK